MARKQKTEDELEDEASALLWERRGDRIALALDRLGWMIVPKPEFDYRRPWSIYRLMPGERCPDWALPPRREEPAPLRLIEGGKADPDGPGDPK